MLHVAFVIPINHEDIVHIVDFPLKTSEQSRLKAVIRRVTQWALLSTSSTASTCKRGVMPSLADLVELPTLD